MSKSQSFNLFFCIKVLVTSHSVVITGSLGVNVKYILLNGPICISVNEFLEIRLDHMETYI